MQVMWSSSIISAVFCQDPPVADSNTCSSTALDAERDPNTQLFPYQTTVIYTCDGELKFYDGTQSKSVLCEANAEWSEYDMPCQSEYLSSIVTDCYIGSLATIHVTVCWVGLWVGFISSELRLVNAELHFSLIVVRKCTNLLPINYSRTGDKSRLDMKP